MLLTILSMLLLISYIVYAMSVIKAVPWSISDTYYQLEKRFRPKWLFQLAMIAPAMLLLPAWLDCSPSNIQFLSFLSCGGLVFVGAAPQFKLSLTGSVHYVSAAVCVIFSQLWVACTSLWWILLPVWGVYFTYTGISIVQQKEGVLLYKFIQTKPMFWVEVAALTCTFLVIFLLKSLNI